MKRKHNNINDLCETFEKVNIKQRKIQPKKQSKWKNIFNSTTFKEKDIYSYEELCEILNKHDDFLMKLYIKSTEVKDEKIKSLKVVVQH